MATAITLDLGPEFVGQVVQDEQGAVCVLSPSVSTNADYRKRVREMLKGQGTDCGECRGCLVGEP